MKFFMYAHRNAPAVILNGNGIVLVDGNIDLICIAVSRFIHCVVDYFPEHVMKAAAARAADIHAGTHSNCLQALHYPYIFNCIIMLLHVSFPIL